MGDLRHPDLGDVAFDGPFTRLPRAREEPAKDGDIIEPPISAWVDTNSLGLDGCLSFFI